MSMAEKRWQSAARWLGAIGAGFAGSSVALGAFAAHALEGLLHADRLAVLQTGADYLMAHGLALLAIAAVCLIRPTRGALYAAVAIVLGTLLFSGSLAVIALSGLRWVGIVTPFGGTLLILGWIMLAVALLGSATQPHPPRTEA